MFTVMLRRSLISFVVLASALGLGWTAYDWHLGGRDGDPTAAGRPAAEAPPGTGGATAPSTPAEAEAGPGEDPLPDERSARPEVAAAAELEGREPSGRPAVGAVPEQGLAELGDTPAAPPRPADQPEEAISSRAPAPEEHLAPSSAAPAVQADLDAPEARSPVAAVEGAPGTGDTSALPPEAEASAPSRPAEPARAEAPGSDADARSAEQAAAGQDAERSGDPDGAPWRPFDFEALRGVLSGILGREDQPPDDGPVAPGGEPAPATGLEETARPALQDADEAATTARAQEAGPERSPPESLSLESIRRALAALVGGSVEPEPDVLPEPAAGPEPGAEPLAMARAQPEEQGPVPPRFDIVRVGPDGRAVIAGRAEPGTEVEIMSGERVLERVPAGRRGHWIATPVEPLQPGDHELTLVSWRAGERLLDSEEVVVLAVPEAPPPQPPRVAASEPPPPQPASVAGPEPAEALAVAMPRRGEGGGRILQAPGRISGDGRLALMVVDYDERGMTRLTGEAPPGAAVRIYVDNQPAADVIAQASGEWAVALDERLQPGTYTLRLDQLDAEGRPVARLETPFTRVSQPPIEGDVQVDYVVVQPGNSLWRISRRLFGEGVKYVHIYQANQAQIRDPDLIYPGQVFEIPKELSAG